MAGPEAPLVGLRRRNAIHEAAHAVIALELGWNLLSIDMSDFDPAELVHGDTLAVTSASVPASLQYEVGTVAQILAGYVAQHLWAPRDGDVQADLGPADDVVSYVLRLVDDEGDIGDLGALVEFLHLPPSGANDDGDAERRTAFEWAVRFTFRRVVPLMGNILRVAHRVEQLGPGEQLDGAYITSLCGR